MSHLVTTTNPRPESSSFIPDSEGCVEKKPENGFGEIVSHDGYPKKFYPNNLNCTWKISAPQKKIVGLYFIYFDVQPCSPDCWCDSLTIYDGPDAFSPVIGKVCGWKAGKVIFSSARNVTLRFISDSNNRWRGFSLRYWFLDEGECLPFCIVKRQQLCSVSCSVFDYFLEQKQ